MQNPLYDQTVAELSALFGKPRALVNKNGVRFQRNGSVTVYHDELAPGNQAEIAFNVQAIGSTFGVPPKVLEEVIGACRAATGCPVGKNKQQDWPRIGIAQPEHLQLVKARLGQALQK